MKTDVIVIGAGASGLMCAVEAGRRGRSVVVLEHNEKGCGKVRVSGGGHCNFTNRNVSREHYLSENPHFAASALARFTPQDFIACLDRHRITYQEREAGRLFCRGSAQQIVDMLAADCAAAAVRILPDCRVLEVRKGARFSIAASRGDFECESLVIATGGLAAPSLGATNFGYATAKRFGIRVTALRPALAPFRFSREDATVFSALSGISVDAVVSYRKTRFHDKVLFTHRGLSGPAVLQISSYWDGDGAIAIDLLPELDICGALLKKRHGKMQLATLLGRYLPGRLAQAWCERCCQSRPLNQYTEKELEALASSLHNWQIRPAGTEGFNKAEVTLGGVDTNELSSQTMEVKKVAGLYFVGEVVDVTGQLGGYNLHWAWASGHAAGQYA